MPLLRTCLFALAFLLLLTPATLGSGASRIGGGTALGMRRDVTLPFSGPQAKILTRKEKFRFFFRQVSFEPTPPAEPLHPGQPQRS
jgi:hypothetical protein